MSRRFFFLAAAFALTSSLSADAQTGKKGKATRRTDTQSVVVLPEAQRPQIDSAALKPEKQKRRRRFEVKVVPAPPPGRSWQEIRYSDSLGKQP